MCYTAEASRNAFFINFISSAILFIYGNPILKMISIFLMYVGLVQLCDWILWENQDNDINLVTTKIQMLIIHLQPIVLAYLLYHFNQGKLSLDSLIITLIYTIVIIIYTNELQLENEKGYTKIVNENSKKHLIWPWVQASLPYILFVIAFTILFLQNLPQPYNYLFAGLSLLTYLFSVKEYKYTEAGTWWCRNASFIPFFLLVFLN